MIVTIGGKSAILRLSAKSRRFVVVQAAPVAFTQPGEHE